MSQHRRERVVSARRTWRGWILGGWCSWLLLAAAVPGRAASSASEVPDPPDGEWASSTLALLRYNHDLCDKIAGDVLSFWAGAGAGAEQAARDHVLHRSISDLAAARAASDFARRFLPRAKSETSVESGASLERLSKLQSELCNLVALPTAPFASFEAAVRSLSDRIAREETELGRLLVVPDDVLRRMLEPYLVHIELAGVKAEGELIDYVNSQRKEPEPPTMAELMAGWYQGYAQAVQPVKAALGKVLGARRSGDRTQLSNGCRELTRAVVPVLDRPEALRAPDARVNEPLRRAYQHMQRLAGQCTSGNFKEVDKSMALMQQELQTAAAVLGKYALQP